MTLKELADRLEPIMSDLVTEKNRTNDSRMNAAKVVGALLMYALISAAEDPPDPDPLLDIASVLAHHFIQPPPTSHGTVQ